MEYNQQIKNRLKRVEGQVRGILKMLEENQECEKVMNQLSAISSAIDHTIGVIVSENLKICITKQIVLGNSSEESVKEAVKLLVRSR